MDDFMMFKYLKENGMLDYSSIMEKCTKYMADQNKAMWGTAIPAHEDILLTAEKHEGHIDCEKAKHIVSQMYHLEGSKRYIGEKFCMEKAKETYDKYHTMLHSSVTVPEVYIAINAQYHDYAKLFKSWFSDNLDCKIIEAAMLFWFMDDDYSETSKVAEYFKIH